VDEVLRRCEAYLRAGVDMLMITALQSREEIRAVREAFPDALLKLNISINPPLTQSEFRDFRISIYDISISKIAQMMMFDFLTRLRRDGIAAFNEFTQTHKDHPVGMFGFLELTGFPKLLEIERTFLDADALAKYDQSIGLYDPRAQEEPASAAS
jgi:2-methylisocitrate lyase-like PEP mutase family enzyme